MMKKIKTKISLASSLVYLFLAAGSAYAQVSVPTGGLPTNPNGIKGVLTNFLEWLLGIVGFIAIIAFVISGIQYLTAAGSEDQMETAKRNLLYSIIGVIVALAGFVIVQAIDTALRGYNAQF